MKKILSLAILAITIWITSAQNIDTWFSDAVDWSVKPTLDMTALRAEHKPVNVSCSNLSDYIVNLAKNQQIYNPWIMYAQDKAVSTNWMIAPRVWWTPEATSVSAKATTNIWDHSDTNSQILGVQESDILRSNGKYMFYYNQKTNYIQIISIPTWNDKPKIINNIKMPEGYQWAALQLYNDKLIIITNKYNNTIYNGTQPVITPIENNTKTYIAIYNISNISQIKFEKIISYDGYMWDNRMIWSKLYLVTNTNISYNRLTEIKAKIDSWTDLKSIKSDIQIQLSGYCNWWYIYTSWENNNIMSIMSIDLWANNQASLTAKKSDYPSNIKNIIWWNPSNFFMSTNYMYIMDPVYIQAWNFKCPPNARCMNPLIYMPSMVYTNIVKLSLDDLWYQWNNLTTWSIDTPYNMWEYDNWLIAVSQLYDSKTNQPDSAVTKFDQNMNIVKYIWSVMPNEQLKSVRYMWDKMYMVTYMQTDPLFVIDLKDLKILWKLVIPWFSTYLHPYSTIWNKQYLIWLGSQVDTGTNRIIGIKLDLYEVDFGNNKPTMKQKYTKTIWGKWSYSEALDNPRMFVRDTLRQKLLIPIRREEYNCNKDGCNNSLLFDGFKSIGIYINKWIIQHWAYDYQKYNSVNDYYGYGSIRVWYSSDTMYYINPWFVDFLRKGTLRLDQK